ncbi:MAG TPA: hypothetical protein VG755_38490 [Nannocystaceae bacterium]|nr:hypothetical protein [Nannocystaceae bacterium]
MTEPKMLRACASCGEPVLVDDGRATCPHCGAARLRRGAAMVMLASSALAGCLAIEPDYGIADVGSDTFEDTGVTTSTTATDDTTTAADESSSESTTGESESTSSESTSSESTTGESGSESTSSESTSGESSSTG